MRVYAIAAVSRANVDCGYVVLGKKIKVWSYVY